MKRIVLSIFLSVCFILTQRNIVSAHSTVVYTTYTRDELSGWMANESEHIGTISKSTKIYYGFHDSLIDSDMKAFTRVGADSWSSLATLTYSEQGYTNQTYYVEFVTAPLTSGYAATRTNSSASNGHYTKWQIAINSNKLDKYCSAVAAHEFGHVFGLADLYSSSNRNKLMYYNLTSIKTPQTYDIKGFNVITGRHTSHSFGNTYYRIHEDPDRAYHRRFCVTCNIILDTACYPKTGVCNTCGFSHTGSSVNSLIAIQ